MKIKIEYAYTGSSAVPFKAFSSYNGAWVTGTGTTAGEARQDLIAQLKFMEGKEIPKPEEVEI